MTESVLIAGKSLELDILNDNGDVYRGQRNELGIVIIVKIGSSNAAKHLSEMRVQRLSES